MRSLSSVIFRCCVAGGMVFAGWAGYHVAARNGPEAVGNEGIEAPGKVAGRVPREVSTGTVANLADLAKRMDDEELRAHEAWTAIKDLPAERIREELLPLAKDMSSSLGEFHMMMLFRWAQLEPHAAMDYAECFPNLLDVGPCRVTAFTSWWKKDPAGAYQWAISDPAAQKERLEWVVSVLKKEAGDMALQRAREQGRDALDAMAFDLVPPASDQVAMDRLMESAGSHEVRDALKRAAFAKDLEMADPPGTIEDPFAESPGSNAARSLHDALARLDDAELPPGDVDQILDRKLPEWSRTRGQEVMSWLVGQEGFGASERQRNCLNQWFFEQPDEAAEWLLAQGNASGLYEGVASTARRMQAALEVGASRAIRGGGDNQAALAAVLARWESFDPAAVERWRLGIRSEDLRASGGIQPDRFNFESEGF
ncbi:hypothetical protein OJ996_24175 [Luteolibacter sp. GHJ8]|uniref:DUF4375 domain-containing protein n=1 Tax=Luteolibacter rhizosphaerae TaxID=2989719 RepID=A0ABT3GA38_9BACT|nr:hypothetical protein [Luteolibacter rhizosphaerae]MCW1916706.1 hypothetical protein [Luteolibacter rhizosphaerae]